ncbi:MAG TPA: gamma-glutamyl-gamma-aminobutyrate hydrolase family protein [Thermoanaerobaculia bacterium]|jgi:gamma-glutamyl-gamma-aminobutyrate hydrolase PuuD|nr:gamma-glutamyl-gamma-aminobutyrate hydrolase family protein [Thermoanaerobaculia bacterium]
MTTASSMSGAVLVSATTDKKAEPYVAALVVAGVPGESIRVVASAAIFGTGATGTTAAAAAAAELAAGAAGLVLCGGADVDPRRYGEEPLPGAGVEALPERDALEWELLAAARERRLPVWAVCRGFQVLNVFFGGSLWQDLPLQRPTAVVHDPDEAPHELQVHALRVLAPEAPIGERLAAAGPAPRVNSRHHQGVKRLGDGLLAVAAAEDGLIEAAVLGGGPGGSSTAGAAGAAVTAGVGAAEGDGWWVRGVEWHPENLLALPEQLALWHDFAAALAARRDQGR